MKTESKDLAIQKAMTELTGVRKAAVAAGRRMQALERQADEIHTRTMISCTARVVSTKEGGIHALITDQHGSTVELSGGSLAISVTK